METKESKSREELLSRLIVHNQLGYYIVCVVFLIESTLERQ